MKSYPSIHLNFQDEDNDVPFIDYVLPREVALHIFSFLTVRDVVACSAVNRAWHDLTCDDELWRRLAHREDITNLPQRDVKAHVVRVLGRKKQMLQAWLALGAVCRTLHRTGARMPTLCSAAASDDAVVAGYHHGNARCL